MLRIRERGAPLAASPPTVIWVSDRALVNLRSELSAAEDPSAARGSVAPCPGMVLGERFDLEHPAARGGMGRIWRARDRLSGRAVAVKFVEGEDEEIDRPR